MRSTVRLLGIVVLVVSLALAGFALQAESSPEVSRTPAVTDARNGLPARWERIAEPQERPPALPAVRSGGPVTEITQDDGTFEFKWTVQATAGPSDYFFIRYPAALLPTPPYVIHGAEIHGDDIGTSTPFAEVGIILGDPSPDCPNPSLAAISFPSPAYPSVNAPDSIYVFDPDGIYISSATDVWVYAQFPSGVPNSEQPSVATDDSDGAAANTFYSTDPSSQCTEFTGQTAGMRLLVSDPPEPGFVGMWSSPLSLVPDGWLQPDFLFDRFVRGTGAGEDPGASGGVESHLHSVNPPATLSGNNSNDFVAGRDLGLNISDNSHKHNVNIPTFDSGSASVLPLHRRLTFLMADSIGVVPQRMIGLWSGTLAEIPGGWRFCDGTEGGPDLQNRFVRGTAAGEEPGTDVAATSDHAHVVNPPATGTGEPTATAPREGSANPPELARSDHTHTLNIPAFDSGSTAPLPSYTKLAFVEARTNTDPAPPPAGLILMWAGPLGTIPTGWALCDGTGGTPDLQSRFVLGVSGGEDPGATGGAESHVHSVNPLAHRTGEAHGNGRLQSFVGNGFPTLEHDHNVNIPAFDSAPASHLPPFYELAFIMKLDEVTGVEEVAATSVRNRVTLHPAFPNPLDAGATIRFELPRTTSVELAIYDAAGRHVHSLVSSEMEAGPHEVLWDGRNEAGEPVSAGIYFARIVADGVRESRKMTVLR